MAAFDPAVATAAYMATLSPAAHAKATAYTHGGEWLLLWSWAVSVLVAVLVLRSGVLARLRDRINGARPRPNLTVLVCAVVFTLATTILSAPWSAYATWWRERGYGLTSQPFAGWVRDWAIGALIDTVVTAAALVAIYALMRRTRPMWWAWAAAVSGVFVVVLVVLGPVLIDPLFNRYTPAPPGPVRDAVATLAKRVGVPSDKIFIFNGSRQSNRYTANVSGLFGSARVAMSDVMFARNADIPEVRGVVGHEMGHYVLLHTLQYAGFLALLLAIGYALADRLFNPAARWLGAGSVTGIADPAGLPVLLTVLTTLALLATPVLNTISRRAESQADHFSMVHANEPDGLSRALVKTIEYRASSPSRLEEWLFYDHPSVERRVRRAMEWKAAHVGFTQ